MTTYTIRRLILSVIVLLPALIFVFLAMRLLPGDPVLMYMSASSVQEITEEQLEQVRYEFGLE